MMEDLVAADTGEVVLLKVNYQHALQLEGEVQSAVGYCILKRPGGFLLALPPTYIPQPVLEEASREGFLGILGPYTVTTASAVELAESGECSLPARSPCSSQTFQNRLWPGSRFWKKTSLSVCPSWRRLQTSSPWPPHSWLLRHRGQRE